MSAVALSIFVFGIYLIITGLGFAAIPNILLPLLKFPKSTEPWVRVVGIIVVVFIGKFYKVMVRIPMVFDYSP